MRGAIFTALEKWIVEEQGLDAWHQVKKESNCEIKDNGFLHRSYYPDEDMVDILAAMCNITAISKEEALRSFGQFFLSYMLHHGYHDILRCQGRNLRQWLSNLNAMHDHVAKSFSEQGKFHAPIFWCEDCDQVEGCILLHYCSLRGTFFVPFVVGIVEEVARILFDMEIELTQLSLQEEDGNSFTTWRISAIDDEDDDENDDGKDHLTADHFSPIDMGTVSVPAKCPFSGISGNFERKVCRRRSSRRLSEDSSFSRFDDSVLGQGLSARKTREAFPFHIMVARDFTILQVGLGLPKLLRTRREDLIGEHIENFLEISRPVMGSSWDWKALKKLQDQQFSLVPNISLQQPSDGHSSQASLQKKVSMEDSIIRFKGSIFDISEDTTMFVLSPDARDVVDLKNMGLTMSDLPMGSCQRDVVLLGEYIRQQVNEAHQLDKLSKRLANEQNLSRTLLHNMLPPKVAEELRRGKAVEPQFHENTTLFFSDIEGFTALCNKMEPWDVIELLNRLYSVMDYLASHFKLFKVETIGDAYMCCAGLEPDDYHAERVANFALAVVQCVKHIKLPDESSIRLRIGIHTGQCTSGVVGTLTPRYCLFGDFVNTTSRHETTGMAGKIHCSSDLYGRLEHCSAYGKTKQYNFTPRGLVDMKGKGQSYTYWLDSATEANSAAGVKAIAALSRVTLDLLSKNTFKLRRYFSRNGALGDGAGSVCNSTTGDTYLSDSYSSVQFNEFDNIGQNPVEDSTNEEHENSHISEMAKETGEISWSHEETGHDLGSYADPVEIDEVVLSRSKKGMNSLEESFVLHDNVDTRPRVGTRDQYCLSQNGEAWMRQGILDPNETAFSLRDKVTEYLQNILFECLSDCDSSKMDLITSQLSSFVATIASSYNADNEFYSFRRACQVLWYSDYLWQRIQLQDEAGIGADAWDRFMIAFAALSKDTKNPVGSNSNDKSEATGCAEAYRRAFGERQSPHKRFSLQYTLSLLEDDCFDLYEEVCYGTTRFNTSVTEMAVATDYSSIDRRVQKIRSAISNSSTNNIAKAKKKQAAMELVLMLADTAHYSQSDFWEWQKAEFRECFMANHSSRKATKTLSNINDKNFENGWFDRQTNLFENGVMLLLAELELLLPGSSSHRTETAMKNLNSWKDNARAMMKAAALAATSYEDLLSRDPEAIDDDAAKAKAIYRALVPRARRRASESELIVLNSKLKSRLAVEVESMSRIVERYQKKIDASMSALLAMVPDGETVGDLSVSQRY